MDIFTIIYSNSYYIKVCKSFDKHDYLDILHDAIIKIYETKPIFETEKQLQSYFYKTAKSIFLEAKQKPDEIEITNDITADEQPKYDISKLLEQPPKDKDDFINKEITKLYIKLGSYKAVAKKTNIPERTIGHIVNKFIKDARNQINS